MDQARLAALLVAEFERCWPWLAAAAARSPRDGVTRDRLWALIASRQAQLWAAPNAAMATQLCVEPRGICLHFWLGGGELGELLALVPGMEAWGRAQGAGHVTIIGRKGWDRVLARIGFRREGMELVKAL